MAGDDDQCTCAGRGGRTAQLRLHRLALAQDRSENLRTLPTQNDLALGAPRMVAAPQMVRRAGSPSKPTTAPKGRARRPVFMVRFASKNLIDTRFPLRSWPVFGSGLCPLADITLQPHG